MSTVSWLAAAGILIIVVLAFYGAWLWWRVWQLSRQHQARKAARNHRLAGDIQILASSLLDGRLPMAEGAIRIKVLLDNYDGLRKPELPVAIFETIYESTAHIPTHQAWLDLTKAERELHRRHMDKLEQEYGPEVRRAAQQLSTGIAPGPSEL